MEESLGQHLHQLRVERGYSLEQIAEKTCVNLPYLKALEDNDFSRLPHAEIFAKSYVHAYCECLSADETTAMTLFAEAAGKFYKMSKPARIPKHEVAKEPHASLRTKLSGLYANLRVLF